MQLTLVHARAMCVTGPRRGPVTDGEIEVERSGQVKGDMPQR